MAVRSQCLSRAKFRSDLITDTKASEEKARHRQHHHHHHHHRHEQDGQVRTNGDRTTQDEKDEKDVFSKQRQPDRFRRPSHVRPMAEAAKNTGERTNKRDGSHLGDRRTREDMQRTRSLSPMPGREESVGSEVSLVPPTPLEDQDDLDELANQDIEELWYSSLCLFLKRKSGR